MFKLIRSWFENPEVYDCNNQRYVLVAPGMVLRNRFDSIDLQSKQVEVAKIRWGKVWFTNGTYLTDLFFYELIETLSPDRFLKPIVSPDRIIDRC